MCSVETNDMVEVQENGLLKVQESHPALGESLRSGETNRTAEEIRKATSGATLLTTQGSTVHYSILSTTLGDGPSLASPATAAGTGSSAHSSDPPRSSTNHPMAPTASAMWQSRLRLHPPH
jgi:hypothetical protein